MNYAKIHAKARRAPGFKQLEAKLLAIAPGRVVPLTEAHMTDLLERGAVVNGKVRVREGEPNRCHFNAAARWLRDPRAIIYTGYYYHDGVWRQHSWNNRGAEILDTDDTSVCRFGVAVPDQPWFAMTALRDYMGDNFTPAAVRHAIGIRAERRLLEIAKAAVGANAAVKK